MSKWVWFYDLIQQKLASILNRFGFKQLTGKGYEEDENKDTHAILMYASDTNVKLSVELLSQMSIAENEHFYLIRIYAGKDILKQWLYPDIRFQTHDINLWEGWKCHDESDVEQAIDEISEGLERYLAENKPL